MYILASFNGSYLVSNTLCHVLVLPRDCISGIGKVHQLILYQVQPYPV